MGFFCFNFSEFVIRLHFHYFRFQVLKINDMIISLIFFQLNARIIFIFYFFVPSYIQKHFHFEIETVLRPNIQLLH